MESRQRRMRGLALERSNVATTTGMADRYMLGFVGTKFLRSQILLDHTFVSPREYQRRKILRLLEIQLIFIERFCWITFLFYLECIKVLLLFLLVIQVI